MEQSLAKQKPKIAELTLIDSSEMIHNAHKIIMENYYETKVEASESIMNLFAVAKLFEYRNHKNSLTLKDLFECFT